MQLLCSRHHYVRAQPIKRDVKKFTAAARSHGVRRAQAEPDRVLPELHSGEAAAQYSDLHLESTDIV